MQTLPQMALLVPGWRALAGRDVLVRIGSS